MKLRQIGASASRSITRIVGGLERLAKFERILAIVCISIPFLLIAFDNWTIRKNISAYYNMEENQMFYFPLTVAVMLFIVNGVVKRRHIYNIFLGLMLAGVILFNRDDASLLHNGFAIAFFGGNAVVILLFSSKKELWFKALLFMGILLSMLGYFLFDWFTLFWAEWLSFAIIALHYVIESWKWEEGVNKRRA
jgi:hypothetical protein